MPRNRGERWLDVNYGAVLRTLLIHGLGGEALHVVAPAAMPFVDATTTGAITCFRAGRRDRGICFREVSAPGGLGALEGGKTVSRARLDAARRWSPFLRPAKRPPPDSMELGEICRVHRGQVTGCNAVWIAGGWTGALPERPEPWVARMLIRDRHMDHLGGSKPVAKGLRDLGNGFLLGGRHHPGFRDAQWLGHVSMRGFRSDDDRIVHRIDRPREGCRMVAVDLVPVHRAPDVPRSRYCPNSRHRRKLPEYARGAPP